MLFMHSAKLATSLVAALLASAAPGPGDPGTAVLRFPATGAPSLEGVLLSDEPVIVDYDFARLPECRARYAGGDAWSISVEYRIDAGDLQRRPVTRLNADRQQEKAPATIDLPPGARRLELWFHSGDRAGCSAYDSDYGRNYNFDVLSATPQ